MEIHKKVSIYGVALVGVAASMAASGQQPAGAGGPMIEEIMVTAQRREARALEVPFTVNTLTAEHLEQSGVSSTMDLHKAVPGITMGGQGAWQQPSIRGVTSTVTSPGADNPVAIYLDGVYLAGQTSMLFDLPDVERIEVLKGPQGTLFGRNATAGAIRIFTRDPSFVPTGKISVTAGMYTGGDASRSSGEYGINGFFSGPLVEDKLAGSLSFYSSKTEGYLHDVVNDSDTGEITNESVRGKFLFTPADNVRLVASAYHQRRKDYMIEAGLPHEGVSAGAHPSWEDSQYGREPWETGTDSPEPRFLFESTGASLNAEFMFDAGTLTSLTGYTKVRAPTEVDTDATYSPSCLEAFACVPFLVENPNETWSQEVTFASERFAERFRYVAGAFAYKDRAEQRGRALFGAFAFENVVERTAWAAFTEWTVDLTDRLELIAGLRYSYEELEGNGASGTLLFDREPLNEFSSRDFTKYVDTDWDSVTPRLSLRYAYGDNSSIYFTYSEGFKSGVVSSSYFDVPAAEPEELKAWEVGFKTAQPRYTLEVAAYYYDYDNLQATFFDGFGDYVANAASAEIYGMEFASVVQVTENFRLSLNASYLKKADFEDFPEAVAYTYPLTPAGLTTVMPYDASGTRVMRSPELTGTLSANYTWNLAGGLVDASGSIYYSDDYTWEVTGRVKTDAYTLLNAELSYSPNDSNWRFSVFGRNLTNEAYLSSALLSATADMVMYGPPRLIGGRIDYQF